MKRSGQFLVGAIVTATLLGFGGVLTTMRYAAQELDRIAREPGYATVEAGLKDLVPRRYPKACKIDLRITEREVAPGVRDAWVLVYGPAGPGGCGAGTASHPAAEDLWFFFRVRTGWVHVPQERHPQITIVGRWLVDQLPK
jgi:hypothetical protein